MDKTSYRVYLTGETVPGFRREDVIAALARAFRAPAGQVLRIMNEGDSPIENLLDADRALQLQMQMESLGARTRVERSAASLRRPASRPVLRLPPEEEAEAEMMRCSACGHRQLSGWKCDECGMVFERRDQLGGDMQAVAARVASQPVRRSRTTPRVGRGQPARTATSDIHSRQNDMLRNDWVDEHDAAPTEAYHLGLFMGINSAALVGACDRMIVGHSTHFRPSWAGGAVFSPFLWAMFRKMWAWGMVILVTEILIPVILLTWGAQDGVSRKFTLLGIAIIVLNRVFWPMVLKWLYCRHSRKAIALMHRMAPTFAPDIDIAARGGTSRTSVFVGLVIALVVSLLTWSIVDSVYAKLKEPEPTYLPSDDIGGSDYAPPRPATDRIVVVPPLQGQRQDDDSIMNNPWVKTRTGLRSVGRLLMSWVENACEDRDLSEMTIDDIGSVLGLSEPLMIDGWGHRIDFHADHRSLVLRSAGPDGEFDNADDIEYRRSLVR
jgi:hypothetical protein